VVLVKHSCDMMSITRTFIFKKIPLDATRLFLYKETPKQRLLKIMKVVIGFCFVLRT